MMGVIFAVASFLLEDIQKFLFFNAWAHKIFVIQKKVDAPLDNIKEPSHPLSASRYKNIKNDYAA